MVGLPTTPVPDRRLSAALCNDRNGCILRRRNRGSCSSFVVSTCRVEQRTRQSSLLLRLVIPRVPF
jgi:hypothetical protein